MYGLSCFLAHQDITPSLAWQDTILDNLKSCDALLPIITKEFHSSFWTDQECGIAFKLDKFILPLRIHTNPYGFLSRFQALKVKRSAIMVKVANQIVKSLSEQKPLKKRLRNSLIVGLKKSRSFAEAGGISAILANLTPFSEVQVETILKSANHNNQIHKSGLAVESIGRILRDNPSRGSAASVKQFKKLTDWRY